MSVPIPPGSSSSGVANPFSGFGSFSSMPAAPIGSNAASAPVSNPFSGLSSIGNNGIGSNGNGSTVNPNLNSAQFGS